ncbi:MAG: response regulator, partial [Patescibacteria group bacterium]
MKILLIEDDPDQITLYQTAFKVAGLDLIVARDGLEGLAKTKEEKPDFILCDLVMEGMAGEE